MNKQRKIILVTALTGLTGIASAGCSWQYLRYRDSRFRWDRISHNLRKFKAQNINDLPIDEFAN